LTGGIGQSHRQNLFQISGSATAITNVSTGAGYQVSPTRIFMGGLGCLGTDGNLWVVLPDNVPKDITPKVQGLNPNDYTFTAGETKYWLPISANGVFLHENDVAQNANFCVGQEVTFQLQRNSVPAAVMATNFTWKLSGTYFNAQTNLVPGVSFPACSSVPYVDTNLLASNNTTAWWVSGTNPPITYPAFVSCSLIFTNGNPSETFNGQGLFTMYRPQAKVVTVTSSASVNSSWSSSNLWFSFGTRTVPGIVFSNSTPISSGNVYWVQVINALLVTRQRSADMAYERAAGSGLDTVYPYGAQPTNNPNRAEDSPGAELSNSCLEYNIVENTFTMWFMFSSTNFPSHTVPLRAVNWSWTGSVTNGVNGWCIEDGTVTNSINPLDFDAQYYPQWNNIINAEHLIFH
jgi:hypothetical protein